jgi:hypothetical protein
MNSLSFANDTMLLFLGWAINFESWERQMKLYPSLTLSMECILSPSF